LSHQVRKIHYSLSASPLASGFLMKFIAFYFAALAFLLLFLPRKKEEATVRYD